MAVTGSFVCAFDSCFVCVLSSLLRLCRCLFSGSCSSNILVPMKLVPSNVALDKLHDRLAANHLDNLPQINVVHAASLILASCCWRM